MNQLVRTVSADWAAKADDMSGRGLQVLAEGSVQEATVRYAGRRSAYEDESCLLVQDSASLVSFGHRPFPVGYICLTVGSTSHLAILARSLGLFCGAASDVARDDGELVVSGVRLRHGSTVRISATGIETSEGVIPLFRTLPTRVRARECKELGLDLYCTAASSFEVRGAIQRGATGVGSVRMEHLVIGQPSQAVVVSALADLLMGRGDQSTLLNLVHKATVFGLTEVLSTCRDAGIPAIVRLPDFDLHDVLEPSCLARLDAAGVPTSDLRGAVFAESAPGFYDAAVRAIVTAVITSGIDPSTVTVVIPYVTAVEQVVAVTAMLRRAEKRAGAGQARVGTMIETPAAALLAGELASHADTFILGTNDLTALTFGTSRHRSTSRAGRDPLELDVPVIDLLRIAVTQGRASRFDLVVGACGEAAALPENLRSFADLGIDFVSPPARLVLGEEDDHVPHM